MDSLHSCTHMNGRGTVVGVDRGGSSGPGDEAEGDVLVSPMEAAVQERGHLRGSASSVRIRNQEERRENGKRERSSGGEAKE